MRSQHVRLHVSLDHFRSKVFKQSGPLVYPCAVKMTHDNATQNCVQYVESYHEVVSTIGEYDFIGNLSKDNDPLPLFCPKEILSFNISNKWT